MELALASQRFGCFKTLTKVKWSNSGRTILIAHFFYLSSHLVWPLTEPKKHQRRMIYYQCLAEVFFVVSNKWSNTVLRGLPLHRNNASAYAAHKTKDFLDSMPVNFLDQSLYSPGLAPCLFFLLPKIKNQFKGISFSLPNYGSEAWNVVCIEVLYVDSILKRYK